MPTRRAASVDERVSTTIAESEDRWTGGSLYAVGGMWRSFARVDMGKNIPSTCCSIHDPLRPCAGALHGAGQAGSQVARIDVRRFEAAHGVAALWRGSAAAFDAGGKIQRRRAVRQRRARRAHLRKAQQRRAQQRPIDRFCDDRERAAEPLAGPCAGNVPLVVAFVLRRERRIPSPANGRLPAQRHRLASPSRLPRLRGLSTRC